MSSYPSVKLGEVLTVKYGKDHKKLSDGSIPCYGTGGIMRYVEKSLSEEESILLPRKGSLNNIYYVDRPFWTVDTLFWSIVNKEKALPKYLFYVLSKIDLASLNVGSAVPSLTVPVLNDLPINLPPLPEQKAIAHILGTLDDKIELNRKMNQTLEGMAQALFKSWFVDFDPVLDNALNVGNEIPEALKVKAEKRKLAQEDKKLINSNPDLASLFPDSFVYSEELGKWIPEGWEVKTLGELSKVISKGTTPRKIDSEGLKESIPFIKVRDIDDEGNIEQGLELIPNEIHLKQLKRSILEKDDLLFSIAGTIGRVAIVPARLNNSNCNQAVAFIRLIDKNQNNILVHQFLRSNSIQGEIHSKVVQAVQANTSLKNLSDLKITCADDETINAFNDAMSDYYNLIGINKKQSETLSQLRDTLLPQLISGKVRIPREMIESFAKAKSEREIA